MSTDSQNNSDNQEIDLSQISKKIGGFFEDISTYIFKGILFLKRNILVIGGLFILGVGLGIYLDQQKNYNSQIIVTPNGGGIDYLYSKIDLVKSKLSERDEAFFKSIGIVNSQKILDVKIEPIIDVYNFVNSNTAGVANAQNTQNFEVIKLLAESNDINKVIEDNLTSKNYPYHSIMLSSNGKITPQNVIQPLLKYLNTDDYMNQVSKINKENILIKMKKNEEEIVQLDSLLNAISKNIAQNNKSNNLIYNNENSQIDELFDLKNKLINEVSLQKIQLVKIDFFIKDISITPNIINKKGINNKMKLILPVLFIFMFLGISVFMSFYRRQLAKSKLQ